MSEIFIYLKLQHCVDSSFVGIVSIRHAIVDLRLDSACAFERLRKKSGVPGERSFTQHDTGGPTKSCVMNMNKTY